MKRHILIDIVRLLALVLVVITHIAQSFGNKAIGGFFGMPGFYYVSLGGVGVSLFLVLSGFGLTKKNFKKPLIPHQFIKTRFLRILPLYWVNLVLSIAIFALKSWYNGVFPQAFFQLDWLDYTCSLTATCGIVGRWGGPFNDASWFIGLLLAMYLVFPWLLKAIKRAPTRTLIAAVGISIVTRVFIGDIYPWPSRVIDWLPITRIGEYVLGMWVAIRIPIPQINIPKTAQPILSYLTDQSYAIYLVHHPMRFMLPHAARVVPIWVSIVIYLTVVLVLAHGVTKVVQKIHRSLL